MRLVVADTGPLNYLVLIDAVDVLPRLFDRTFIPAAVYRELTHLEAPAAVRAWIAKLPDWVEIRPDPDYKSNDPEEMALDEGERAAIALALAINADLILMDDRAGAAVAHRRGFTVTGTLGVLDLAARRGIIDLARAFETLRTTNFRYRPEIMDALLAQYSEKKR
jgi:predicted nucleic acid-binding protein